MYGPNCLCPQKVTLGWWEQWDPCGMEARLSPCIPFPPQKPQLDLEVTSPGVGIQVTVTKGHLSRTFRQAAVLVVAVTKLLKQPSHKDFADSDLGSFLDDIFGMRVMSGVSPQPEDTLGGYSWTWEHQHPPDCLTPHRARLLPVHQGQLYRGTRFPLHSLPVLRHPGY